MKKVRINTEVIAKMSPCKDRFDNWKLNHFEANLTIKQFFKLKDITHSDKIWVATRLLSRTSLEIFAIDSAVSAQQHIDAYAYAAYAAAYAAYAAADTYAYAAYDTYAVTSADAYAYAASYAPADDDAKLKEQEGQLRVLEYLFENDEEEI